ncbi:MAG: hypothetical protein IKQ69_06970 [Oscillospiraceae bacterium]|nr:hypothetical protein [Oscillospiraceae bacterium]MBR6208723.1 hypothetical protein [Oscillospiraceae bacterium]
MNEAVLAAAITAAAGIICQLIISRRSGSEMDAKLDKQQAVTNTKLDELTREVRRHNEFAERIPKLEERLDGALRRIAELERREAL